MTRCQNDDLLTHAHQKWVGANEKCGCALGDHRLESRVYLSRRAGLQDGELPRGGTLRLTQLFHLCIEIRIVGVEQRGNGRGWRSKVKQQAQPLRLQFGRKNIYSRDIPTWPIEAGNETVTNRVIRAREDDRYSRGGCLCCSDRRVGPACHDHRHLPAHQVRRHRWQPFVMVFRPSKLDCEVATFDIARLVQPPAQGGDELLERFGRCAAEKPHYRHGFPLLPARRNRPRCRRAAEQRDELAPPDHSITSSARASSLSGISMPSALAVLRLTTNSNLVDCTTGKSPGLVPLRILST